MTDRPRYRPTIRLAAPTPCLIAASLIAALATAPVLSRTAWAVDPPIATSAPNPIGAATAGTTSMTPVPSGAPSPAPEPALPKPLMVKVEWHIKQLRTQLGITPEEQEKWDAFATVMRDNAAEMNETFTDRSDRIGAMDALDNMQSYAHVAQVHAENMQKLSDAFGMLYNSFPDQQKKVADDVFRKTNAMKPPHSK